MSKSYFRSYGSTVPLALTVLPNPASAGHEAQTDRNALVSNPDEDFAVTKRFVEENDEAIKARLRRVWSNYKAAGF
ncbi:hypothetical protein GAY31_13795 [Azospirillum brasilense]|nr:hypothetical protein [Azospirillum brasilense]